MNLKTHNRTRSPLYPLEYEQTCFGMKKAEAVSNKLKPLMTAKNSEIQYANAWIEDLGDGAFAGVSIVVSCVDNAKARAYLSDKARWHSLPLIEAGFHGPNLSLSCYPAVSGTESLTAPCWRCAHQSTFGSFSCDEYAKLAENQGIIPAIQNGASALGAMQAEAVISALHGEMPFAFQGYDLNIRTGKTLKISLSADKECPGIHTSLENKPLELQTSASGSLSDLLLEIREQTREELTIELPEAFIWETFAPCAQCDGDAKHPN